MTSLESNHSCIWECEFKGSLDITWVDCLQVVLVSGYERSKQHIVNLIVRRVDEVGGWISWTCVDHWDPVESCRLWSSPRYSVWSAYVLLEHQSVDLVLKRT